MDSITCRLTTSDDINNLTTISINSFHSDYEVGAPNKTGGPPGYNTPNFYHKMLNISKAFYTILDEDRIIGGFIIFQKNRTQMELGRIFIDPNYIRKGIGTRSINYLLKKYPHIETWSLDTPSWNSRTRSFYIKMGFRLVKEYNDSCQFSKHISNFP